MIELIKEAMAMLQHRSRQEADLIYYVCKLDEEERGAIILAYQLLFKNEEDKSCAKKCVKKCVEREK